MSMLNKIGDLTAIGVGMASVNPKADMFQGVHQFLASLPTISSADTSEIIRMLAGLLIGLLSKFLYAIIDKKLKKKNKPEPPIQAQPETLNLKINQNEKENSK